MQTLFIFLTQAEGGAPGYLSRFGEQSAENLAENIFQFLTIQLQLDVESGFEERAKSLERNPQWKNFQKQTQFKDAVITAFHFHPRIVLLSGEHFQSLKTISPLAERLALPVCVHRCLDRSSEHRPQLGTLADGLNEYFEVQSENFQNQAPLVVCLGTSFGALREWLKENWEKEKRTQEFENFFQNIEEQSENGKNPVVFVAGAEKENDVTQWTFDS